MSFSMMISTAPPVVELEEAQKFRDEQGNLVEMEVRGRFPDLYFKLADVQSYFGIEDLYEILISDENNFQRKLHYEEFFITVMINNKFRKNIREMFLTHLGLLVVIFVVHTPQTQWLQKWISSMVLRYRMGREEDRLELASDVLGVPAESIHNVLDHPIKTTTPSSFLISLGNLKSVGPDHFPELEEMDENKKVIVFGCADDIQAIVAECYWKYSGADVRVLYSAFVDPVFQMDAKKKLASIMTRHKHPKKDDVAILCPFELDALLVDIAEAFKIFRGRLTTIIEENDKLRKENKVLDKELETTQRQVAIAGQIQNKELEIEYEKSRYKDVLIRQLEIELEHWKVQGEFYEKEIQEKHQQKRDEEESSTVVFGDHI